MKADFSRDTFRAPKQFTRVLMQEGRVQVDADFNEQGAIASHYLRSLAVDLIGAHGGPADALGFEIKADSPNVTPRINTGDFHVMSGIYYVDGLRLENPTATTYTCQPWYKPEDQLDSANFSVYLVYLEAWERLVTYLQDPSIREVALRGPDTAARAQLVWQVKVVDITDRERENNDPTKPPGTGNPPAEDGRPQGPDAEAILAELLAHDKLPLVRFRATRPAGEDDPCQTAPDSKYRGENQLYRVEVHTGGTAVEAGTEMTKPPATGGGRDATTGGRGPARAPAAGGAGKGKEEECGCMERATFKWSRENGSVVFPITGIGSVGEGDAATTTVTLAHLGRDAKSTLQVGDWVEITDDEAELQVVGDEIDPALRRDPGPLLAVQQIMPEERKVVLKGAAACTGTHRILRRWDHKARRGRPRIVHGALEIVEGEWIALEEGVEVFFERGEHRFRPGDYWMAPARVETGDVEWPTDDSGPIGLPPHGVERHYAPLAVVRFDPQQANNADKIKVADWRRSWLPLGRFLPP